MFKSSIPMAAIVALLSFGVAPQVANAQSPEVANLAAKLPMPSALESGPDKWTSPEGVSSTIQVMVLLTVLSLAPAIMLMTTSFVRIVVVLGLLRQALGTQQLPPSQVITSTALFLTLLIMWPVWRKAYDEGVVPYTQITSLTLNEALEKGGRPISRFHEPADRPLQ